METREETCRYEAFLSYRRCEPDRGFTRVAWKLDYFPGRSLFQSERESAGTTPPLPPAHQAG